MKPTEQQGESAIYLAGVCLVATGFVLASAARAQDRYELWRRDGTRVTGQRLEGLFDPKQRPKLDGKELNTPQRYLRAIRDTLLRSRLSGPYVELVNGDVLPGTAYADGKQAPTDRVIDGKDIWPLLAGKAGAKTPYDAFFYHTAQGQLAAVRSGKWKLHLKPPASRGKPKKGQPKPSGEQLYDLTADIGEKTNVAAKNPEVVKRLTKLLQQFDKELKANIRPPGKA